MNFILSSKAAKNLQKESCSIKNFNPDINTWRVDCVSLIKRTVFIITNEKTLYTCISSCNHGFNGIIQKVSSVMQCDIGIDSINCVKFQNRSIVGCMNNMKIIIEQLDQYRPSDNEQYEKLVNQTPFKYLSYRSPADVHLLKMSSHSDQRDL